MRDDTIVAINDPKLAAGVILLAGALMLKAGLTEFTMDSDTYPQGILKQLILARDGNKLTMRILNEGEEKCVSNVN
jgi:hypothetical protein